MSLVRMALTSYRCFARRQDIELRPITVVLGRNNSGKSALVRAPVVCETGIHTDSPAPLDLDRLGDEFLESFTDLVYGSREHGAIGIELTFQTTTAPLRVAATIQNIAEFRTQVVSSLELEAGSFSAQLTWELNDPAQARYTVRCTGQIWTGIQVKFQGLLPFLLSSSPSGMRIPDELATQILSVSTHISASFPAVRYFGPFRERPHRRYRLPARIPTEVGASGEYAAGILAGDSARQGGRLLRRINEDLAENLPGWRLDMAERGGMHSVVLVSQHDETLRVNLADTGTGVAQVLPVFVQRAVDALSLPHRPVLEIIEQPELHLHPAAHAALADLYLSAASQGTSRFLIETHSETFLLRLRRRIAEGLAPETVAVYFVDHADGAAIARKIAIDENGALDYWPAGVFSEDYAETRALAVAQLARRDAGAR